MLYNLTDLWNSINSRFKSGYTLKKCMNLLCDYKGLDYTDYIEFNNQKYNKKIVFKNNNLELAIITWSVHQEKIQNTSIVKLMFGQLEIVSSNNKKIIMPRETEYISCKKNYILTANGAVTIHISYI